MNNSIISVLEFLCEYTMNPLNKGPNESSWAVHLHILLGGLRRELKWYIEGCGCVMVHLDKLELHR